MLWIVQHIIGNHLMGSERWLALSYTELNPLILGLPYQISICVSIFSQTLASSLMCCLKIMRRKLQPWLFNYPALPNLVIILCSKCPISSTADQSTVSKSKRSTAIYFIYFCIPTVHQPALKLPAFAVNNIVLGHTNHSCWIVGCQLSMYN